MACAPGHLHVARASLSMAVSGEFHFGAQQLPVLSVVAAMSPPACRDAGKGLHLLMARRRVTLQKRTWDGRCPRAILETTVCHSLPPCCSSGPEMQVQPPAPPGCGAEPSRLLPSIPLVLLSRSCCRSCPPLPQPPLTTCRSLGDLHGFSQCFRLSSSHCWPSVWSLASPRHLAFSVSKCHL